MIKNMWYAVLESKEVKTGKLFTVKRLGLALVFWRLSDYSIACIEDKCCHRGASLGIGKIHGEHISCPFHGFVYDKNGKVVSIPANGKDEIVADRYKVKGFFTKEVQGMIWLWNGDSEPTEDVNYFEELDTFHYSTFVDHWPVHYTRAIENQLDCVHVPFVHHNTIGSGGGTLVNGPKVTWDDEMMHMYVFNEPDRGQKPLTPDAFKDYHNYFQLQFKFPNSWHNVIADKVRVGAHFAPVDDENTVIYLRYYHRITKLPLALQLINLSGKYFSKIVLRQDKRVVITQRPTHTNLKMDEKLIQGDLPILEYRKHRAKLLEQL